MNACPCCGAGIVRTGRRGPLPLYYSTRCRRQTERARAVWGARAARLARLADEISTAADPGTRLQLARRREAIERQQPAQRP